MQYKMERLHVIQNIVRIVCFVSCWFCCLFCHSNLHEILQYLVMACLVCSVLHCLISISPIGVAFYVHASVVFPLHRPFRSFKCVSYSLTAKVLSVQNSQPSAQGTRCMKWHACRSLKWSSFIHQLYYQVLILPLCDIGLFHSKY